MLSHLHNLHCSATVVQPDGCAFTDAVTLDDYLALVVETSRLVHGDKRGAISANLAPILNRLRINLDAWLALMRSSGHFGLGSFGVLASRAREALGAEPSGSSTPPPSFYRDEQPTALPNTA